MTRVALCVVVLAVNFTGQQKTPNIASGVKTQVSSVITVDQSQVTPAPPRGFNSDTNVPRSSQKGTVQKSYSKASAALDMRPAAVCGRDMNDALDTDKNYIALMEQAELEGLHKRALDCLLLQQSTKALRQTALVLEQTRDRLGFSSGFKSGTARAAEVEQEAIDKTRKANETGKESIVHDYDALVDRYNSLANECNNHDAALVNRYNALVTEYNELLGLAQRLTAAPPRSSFLSFIPTPPPPPPEVHLSCTASPLPGNMATVNCW